MSFCLIINFISFNNCYRWIRTPSLIKLRFVITVKPSISNPIPMSAPQPQAPTVNLINNFNNNYRNQTSGFPHCVALYDFEAENPGELSFKVSVLRRFLTQDESDLNSSQENDIIRLLNKVDENWYEGQVNGRSGYFPQSYVSVSFIS